MPRALNRLRESLHYRREAFDEGLAAAGFDVVGQLLDPRPGDMLIVWNRYGGFAQQADQFEAAGGLVVVVENGYLGKAWRGGEWFAMALGHHAGAGRWVDHGPQRWDSWGVGLEPWREDVGETLIFAQRGIGAPGVRSPEHWAEAARARIGGRIRPHPASGIAAPPLEQDLANVREVVTWHSAAALVALLAGIPAWFAFPKWIGARAGRPLAEYGLEPPRRDDGARLAMFRRLAWANWSLDEIRTGEPLRCLLAAA